MPTTRVLVIEGDPTLSPYEVDLIKKLTNELRPGAFAEIEVPRRESRAVQKKLWNYNTENPDLPWRFRTKAHRVPGTQLTAVRVWKEIK